MQKTPLGISVDPGEHLSLDGVPAEARQRKGWLLLVPGGHVEASDLAAAYEGYYASHHYDVEPTLVASMRSVSAGQDSDKVGWQCCGAVLMGLDVTALLPLGFRLWVIDGSRLDPVASWPMPATACEGSGGLRRSHHRIRPGETLVLGRKDLEPILRSRRARRAAANPARLRRMVASIAARRGFGSLPMASVHYPMGPAVALEEPWDNPAVLLPLRRETAKRTRLSPIWLAIVIVVVSAVGVYTIKRPALSKANWVETAAFLLTVDHLGETNGIDLQSLSSPSAD